MSSLIAFWTLSFIAVAAALSMILNRNPIHSLLSLIVCFFSVAGHYLLLKASFLAIVNIIVYAGAIMVLFLFVIMMMNLNELNEKKPVKLFWGSAIVVTLVFISLLARIVWMTQTQLTHKVYGSAKALGQLLFKYYVVPFELSGVLFLAAIAGVILLNKKDDHVS